MNSFTTTRCIAVFSGSPPPDAGGPGPDPLSDLISTGIPMAIWAREPFPEVELEEQAPKVDPGALGCRASPGRA